MGGALGWDALPGSLPSLGAVVLNDSFNFVIMLLLFVIILLFVLGDLRACASAGGQSLHQHAADKASHALMAVSG